MITGIQPHATTALTSAVSHQPAYIDSWIRQTGMDAPKNSTLLHAVLAQSMSSR